ncbi:8373_t:CDS:2 [Ambispora gerdemannii]|uniref:8373_t:CDS:1 n=1 Tax=Ambispora gerdemannii TaxID=144530 RepID=A0A9N9D9Y9_9GLOM|nr:8373_t:CDS:2 [Ambispora gerdemannii]
MTFLYLISSVSNDVEAKAKFQASSHEVSSLEASAEARFGTGGIRQMRRLMLPQAKGVDLINVETKGVKANIGDNVDTGAFGPDGIEVKVGGFGITIGKEIGTSTLFGRISINLGELLGLQTPEAFAEVHKYLYESGLNWQNVPLAPQYILCPD